MAALPVDTDALLRQNTNFPGIEIKTLLSDRSGPVPASHACIQPRASVRWRLVKRRAAAGKRRPYWLGQWAVKASGAGANCACSIAAQWCNALESDCMAQANSRAV